MKKSLEIKDSVRSYSDYPDKLLHPRKTLDNAFMALHAFKPPISVRFKRIDDHDRLGIPIYTCTMNKEIQKAYPQTWPFRHTSFGKGDTALQSKASAVMELAERFSCHCFFKNSDNFFIAGRDKIKNTIARKSLLLPLQKKYRNAAFISAVLKKAPLRWTRSFSLTKKKDLSFPLEWFSTSTTGFSAGNCMEEAVVQGVSEVIERHAIATITERRSVTPLIDSDSIENGIAKKIILKFHKAGIRLSIKDFSCGLGIPTIGILAYDPKGPRSVRISCAAGTSLNKDIALIRALIEIAQHRSQNLLIGKNYGQTFNFPFYNDVKDADYFINGTRIVDFASVPTYSHTNFRIEIETAVEKLKSKDLEVIVTDVTHPRINIPTVIVSILGTNPGAEPYNPYIRHHDDYMAMENYDTSVGILEDFIRHYPSRKNKMMLLHRSIQYEELKKFTHAIKLYKRIASLCSKNDTGILMQSYKSLIRCYTRLRKAHEVATLYKKMQRLANRGGSRARTFAKVE